MRWWPAMLLLSGLVSASGPRMVASFVVTHVDSTCSAPCDAPGAMTLDTHPWTKVLIDGATRGSTPLFRVRLLPGAHQVRFVNEEQGIDQLRSFDVEGGTLVRVRGTFTEQRAAAETLPAQRFGCGECVEDLKGGALTLAASPWGMLFVDGRKVGATPVFALPLAAGPHALRLEDEDGELMWSGEVKIVAGERVRLHVVDGWLAP